MLLREQVVLAWGAVCCGYDDAVGSWNIVFQDPTVSVLWRCPTLPHPPRCSTIGACGLSFQVRNGGWAFPRGYDHHKIINHIHLNIPSVCRASSVRVGVCVGCDPYSGDEHFFSVCQPFVVEVCV